MPPRDNDYERKHRQARQLAAQGRLTLKQIAAEVGVSESWLYDHGIRASKPQKTTQPDPPEDTILAAETTAAASGNGIEAWRRGFEGDLDSGEINEGEVVVGLPGVRDGPGGLLHDNVADFTSVLDTAKKRFGVPQEDIVRDYHMCEALRRWFAEHPPRTLFHDSYKDHKNRPTTSPAGTVAFAGGSSLTAGYHLADRASEDLDLALAAVAPLGQSAVSRVQGLVVDAAAAACSPEIPPEGHGRGSRGYVGRRYITIGDAREYLKIEATIWQPPDPETQARLDSAAGGVFDPVRNTRCQSLMGRAATPEILVQYPQLAPCEVSALAVPITVCNKLLPLHKRAAQDNLKGLTHRGRDIYDLWCVSRSPVHAAETRAVIAVLAEHLAEHGLRRGDREHPRPEAGFSASAAFDPSSEQYQALSAGYDNALALVWGRRPASFAEAVTAALSLDPRDTH